MATPASVPPVPTAQERTGDFSDWGAPIYDPLTKLPNRTRLVEILNGVEHANFFEARATEYSKAATRGRWDGEGGVWAEFDRMMEKRSGPEAAH